MLFTYCVVLVLDVLNFTVLISRYLDLLLKLRCFNAGAEPEVDRSAPSGARSRHYAADGNDSSAEQRATAQELRSKSQPRGTLDRASP